MGAPASVRAGSPAPRVLRADGPRLDGLNAPLFRTVVASTLSAEAEDPAAGDVYIDLSAVSFIDSAGLGALVACRRLVRPPRRLVLTGLQPAVQRVFAVTRMEKVFDFEGLDDD
ncbi:MAG: STAS domain-containing protein [Pseudomonadota bacterium]